MFLIKRAHSLLLSFFIDKSFRNTFSIQLHCTTRYGFLERKSFEKWTSWNMKNPHLDKIGVI